MGILEKASRDGGRAYKFTSKSQSQKGIMATVLGIIAMVSFFVSNMDSFKVHGEATARSGAVGLVSMIFSLVGLIAGILSLREEDKFILFPGCGTVICIISTLCWTYILLLGTGIMKL